MSSDARHNPPRANLPTCIDARASNFNRVHGDQHNHVQNIIILDASISHRERRQLLRDLCHKSTRPTSTARISPENGAFSIAEDALSRQDMHNETSDTQTNDEIADDEPGRKDGDRRNGESEDEEIDDEIISPIAYAEHDIRGDDGSPDCEP